MSAMQTVKPEILPASPPATAQQLSTVPRQQSSVDDMITTARLMVQHSFVPKHLIWSDKPERSLANCFRVVVQARAWGMDPFAVADNSYVQDGRLEYQGKLVAAVLQKSGVLKDRLRHEITGQGDDMVLTITATLKGEKSPRAKSLRLGDVKTKNQMWGKDDENKLYYSVVRAWARLHCPEIFLGVGASDDIELVPADAAPGLQAGEVDNETDASLHGDRDTERETQGSPPADSQTLQEALAQAPQQLVGDGALAPDGVCDLQLASRVYGAFDVFFVARGWSNKDTTPEQKAEWMTVPLAKRGAKKVRDLTNAQALEIIANLESATSAILKAKQEEGEKK